jgi:hypothetical protein
LAVQVLPIIAPAGQLRLVGSTQPPKRHWVPEALHLAPQAPQLFSSVLGSTQAPPQASCPVGQAQVLGELGGCATQVAPVAQAFAHDPQCCTLVVMSTQAPFVPQAPSPVLHWQAPSKQNWSAGHAWPQLPQFAELPVVSTQELPHCVSEPQPLAHWPPEHTMPFAHRVPQAPQFAGSDVVSVQAPEHDVCPVRQPQAPPEHTWPLGHWAPHAPQFAASVCGFVHAPPHAAVPPEHAPGEVAFPEDDAAPVVPPLARAELAAPPPDVAEIEAIDVAWREGSPGGVEQAERIQVPNAASTTAARRTPR